MKRLLLAGALIGAVALAVRKCAQQRQHWHGLSETDVREKLDQKLANRMPDERREVVTEKIIGRMRDRGVIIDVTDEGSAQSGGANPDENSPTVDLIESDDSTVKS